MVERAAHDEDRHVAANHRAAGAVGGAGPAAAGDAVQLHALDPFKVARVRRRLVGEGRRCREVGWTCRSIAGAHQEDGHLSARNGVVRTIVPDAVDVAAAARDAQFEHLLNPLEAGSIGWDVGEVGCCRESEVISALDGADHEDGHLITGDILRRAIVIAATAGGDAVLSQKVYRGRIIHRTVGARVGKQSGKALSYWRGGIPGCISGLAGCNRAASTAHDGDGISQNRADSRRVGGKGYRETRGCRRVDLEWWRINGLIGERRKSDTLSDKLRRPRLDDVDLVDQPSVEVAVRRKRKPP